MAKTKAQRVFDRYNAHLMESAGRPREWARAANALMSRSGSLVDHLRALGLTAMPKDLAELNKARRNRMLTAHPDKGGSTEGAMAINAAYSAVLGLLPSIKTLAPYTKADVAATMGSYQAQDPSKLIHPPRCTWELPEDLDQPHLIADLKVDGERLVMYLNLNPYTGAASTTMLTRYKGKHTKQYGDRSAAHPDIAYLYQGLDGTIVDCELFQGMLYAFDIPFYLGRDLRKLPLKERREILKECVAKMNNMQIQVIPSWTSNLMDQFQKIVASGGEGLIIKDLNAAYGQNWAKLKKSYDVSCVVMHMNETEKGQGSFTVGIFRNGVLTEVGRCNGGNDSFIGRVVDVFAQELTVHEKLRHGSFHRFRDDMPPTDCTWEKLKDDMSKKARADRIRDKV